jgi:hypothetical protein
MSALPPKANISGRNWNVCFGPEADFPHSFDHFVGAGKQRRRRRAGARAYMTAVDFSSFVDELASVAGETILPLFRTALAVENKKARLRCGTRPFGVPPQQRLPR